MASLGKFGVPHDPIDLDFDYFGEKIRVNPDASQLSLYEWLDDASNIEASNAVLEARMTVRLMREAVHPDDFDRFWEISKRERQEPEEVLAVGRAVMEAVTRFPTGPPSGSSDGLDATPPKSTAASRLQAAARRPGQPATDHALERLRGRPDLQEFVVMNEEAELAKAGTN